MAKAHQFMFPFQTLTTMAPMWLVALIINRDFSSYPIPLTLILLAR